MVPLLLMPCHPPSPERQGVRPVSPALSPRRRARGAEPAPTHLEAGDPRKKDFKTGRTIREVAREKTKLSEADLTRRLNPAAMTHPGLAGVGGG